MMHSLSLYSLLRRGTIGSPEALLVARAKTGNQPAFEELVHRHKDAVLNLARRIVLDADAAQDVTQEVFINAFCRLRQFRGDASFATWLYSITVNQARAYLRGERRRLARLEKQRESAPTTMRPRDDDGPVMALLRELPEKQRVAIALFHLRELSLADISRVMGVPQGTVKAWLSRGRERLRALAAERGLR